ncbi:MAG: nucleotide exchange factor GrpE [Oscillospiraceae bacterium]|nr:nucleotide exchange factor GrpE [Oscillospiraceae bacterium]
MKKNKKNEDTFTITEEANVASSDSPGVEIIDPETADEAQSEVVLLKEQLVRQAAEYDNYRKRTARERLELVPEITAGNVTAFLPILDNIERALSAECSDANYKTGIEMIRESFVTALANLGVEEVSTEAFDPAIHQAVQNVPHDTLESGQIAEVFQKGYRIGNRVIRFAMVAIVE